MTRSFSSRRRSLVASVLTASLLASFASSAFADGATKAAAPAIVDEVRLRDGSMIRGVIVEKSADGEVTLQLASGETRHYAPTDIVFAGPIGGGAVPLPAAPTPATDASEPSASVHLEANTPGLRVHVSESRSTIRVGVNGSMMTGNNAFLLTGESFRPLCVAPCDASLHLGSQRVAVTAADDAPLVVVSNPVDVRPGGKYMIDFESKADTRSTGTALMWIGALGGLAATIGGIAYGYSGSEAINYSSSGDSFEHSLDERSKRRSTGLAISLAGIGIGTAVLVVGLVLRRQHDSATVHERTSEGDAPKAASNLTSLSTPVL